jgi:hypothetical protein
MVRPYSHDLRERLVRAVLRGGLSCHQAAAQFGVAISTAINWVRRFRGTGSIEPGQIGGYRWQTMTFLAALRHDRITARGTLMGRSRPNLPALCRKGPGSDIAARRHRDHGQSRLTQRQRRAARYPGRRRAPLLPAEMLA